MGGKRIWKARKGKRDFCNTCPGQVTCSLNVYISKITVGSKEGPTSETVYLILFRSVTYDFTEKLSLLRPFLNYPSGIRN